MDINKFVDGQMAAWARNDLIGMLADAGHALVQTGLKVNGVRYQDMLVGPLLIQAAAALEECWKREGLIQAAAKPDKPDDGVVKVTVTVTVPDRWPMTEAGQRRAAQEAAAPKPMTNGDRIRAMTAEELAERERLERLYEETRQIADRRAWDETSRTMAYNCGQEANDGQ
jgi:hypothetical protein|nr:MAG TPA: hypothetical protein [Caudoviricetes sp.]